MSKHINVNPDHYKVAGRERPGDAIVRRPKELGDEAKARERWQRSRAKAVTKAKAATKQSAGSRKRTR